jgi:hypothetical protein
MGNLAVVKSPDTSLRAILIASLSNPSTDVKCVCSSDSRARQRDATHGLKCRLRTCYETRTAAVLF